jgi:hypothetical protein
VRLTGGPKLRIDPPAGVEVKELLSPGATALAGAIVNTLFLPVKPFGVAPPMNIADSRFFLFSSKAAHLRGPVKVQAINPATSRPETALNLSVLGARKVKLSIRPVQVRDQNGAVVYHSKKPFDIAALVATMNSIWKPQANVVFELISSNPVLIDDVAVIAKALDVTPRAETRLPPMVVLQRFETLLDGLKDRDADITMFLVKEAGDLNDPNRLYIRAANVAGVTNPRLGISLISDSRELQPEVMAHEAGHTIGSFIGTGQQFVSFGHRGDKRALMHEGGSAVAKIPFQDTLDFFNRTR